MIIEHLTNKPITFHSQLNEEFSKCRSFQIATALIDAKTIEYFG
jgi:hypothetical protein